MKEGVVMYEGKLSDFTKLDSDSSEAKKLDVTNACLKNLVRFFHNEDEKNDLLDYIFVY